MRRGLTLLELIFSMVIIALAFTVLPKILQVSAKSSVKMLKEEAMSDAVALIGLIKALPWDENNTQSNDILHTDLARSNAYRCDPTTHYRRGGFAGSRGCFHDRNASAIGADSGESEPDDIDDFEGFTKTISNAAGTRRYTLGVRVCYVADAMNPFSRTCIAQTSDIKYVDINITPLTKQKELASTVARFYYHAANIGQQHINRRPWRK